MAKFRLQHRSGMTIMLVIAVILTMVPAWTSFAETKGTPESEPVPASAPAVVENLEPEPVVVLPGKVQISLNGTNGVPLSGLFAITDAAGAYHEVWVQGGYGISGDLPVGQATVVQKSGIIDYWFDGTAAQFAQVPAAGTAAVQFTNTFIDTDGDGIGDSVDLTPNGDTYRDGIDNLADLTPNDPTNDIGDDDTGTLLVNKASQSIDFLQPADKTYGDAPFELKATASSGLTVTFNSQTASICTVSESTVTITGVGSCTITASQAGNDNYNAAPDVNIPVTISHITLVEGTHYTFGCDQTSLAASSFTQVDSTCTVTALTLPAGSEIGVSAIKTTLAGGASGWTINLAKDEVAFGTLPGESTLSEVTLGSGDNYSFNVVFTPTACDATSNPPTVGVSLAMAAVIAGDDGPDHTTAPAQQVAATFTAMAAESNAFIANPGVGAVILPYSFSEQSAAASFTLNFTVTGCGQQKVSASMGLFTGPGTIVPILDSASAGTPVPLSGTMDATSDPITTLSSDPTQPTRLMVGNTNGSPATVSQLITLNYTIPGNTLVGEYTATITVTTGDAP